MVKALRTFAAAAFLPLLATGHAHAAPQALLVVATAEPVELTCEGGRCSAELTSMCLQEYRASPARGTRYTAHDPSQISVWGERLDGSRVRLAVADELRITSERGHSAIRVALPVEVVETFALTGVHVAVESDLALIPIAVAGDSKPFLEGDIALSTGLLRDAAQATLGRQDTRTQAARLTSHMINALPARGRADTETRDRIFARTSATVGRHFEAGTDLARGAYDKCHAITYAGRTTLRQCLGSLHDIMIGDVNEEYWDAVKTGS